MSSGHLIFASQEMLKRLEKKETKKVILLLSFYSFLKNKFNNMCVTFHEPFFWGMDGILCLMKCQMFFPTTSILIL